MAPRSRWEWTSWQTVNCEPLDPSEPNTASRVDAYEVTIQPQALRVGEPTLLSFAVTGDGRQVEDLERYLGAMGHLVALRRGDLAYLHVHPMAHSNPGVIKAFNNIYFKSLLENGQPVAIRYPMCGQ